MAWLASDFLLELRRATGVAAASANSPEGLTDADLLPLIDREIQTALVPLMMRCREEFFVLKKTYAVDASTLRVRFPSRTIGGRLRDVRLTINQTEQRLVRFQPEEKARLFPQLRSSGALAGYYVEGEWLVLLGSPTQAASLDVYYFGRPGRLTITAAEFEVVAAKAGLNFSLTPGTLTATTLAYDVIRGGSGLSTLIQNLETDGASVGDFDVFDATTVSYIDVGDYVSLADKTPVIPLPVELHGVLLSRSVVAVLRQLGSYKEADAEERRTAQLEQIAVALLTPRVESQAKVVVGTFHWRRRRGNRGGGF